MLIAFCNPKGTANSDSGLEAFAARRSLVFLNVARCSNVTARGVSKAMHMETLHDLTLSGERLAEAEAST
jgi:hypothetical protein